MSLFAPAPPPPSKLGIYRVLSSRAGVRVSPLQLGAMSIGDKWNLFMGSMDKEASFQLLNAYFDLGGNFIDTANNYQNQSSEQFIGEWAEKRGIRDQLVISTKYSINYFLGDDSVAQKVNFVGNSTKSMHLSLEASLKKLRTTYVDILYVHYWDFETSIEEVMNSLHALVLSGKVLYLGISDTPAWVVSQANQYAKDHGKTPFVIYQGLWNVLDRSFEREIIPMARAQGMALAPWSVLAGGKLRSDAEEQKEGERRGTAGDEWPLERSEARIAIAYVMHKTTNVFPIIGGRKVEHLKDNMEALDISLSTEQIKYLDVINPFDPGFPSTLIGDGTYYNRFLASAAQMAKQPLAPPIKP
ncbi:arylalcohol dehydrogenase [Hymenopellis radicata]|nr:arylalcohol dehydrogenase [Hymenopellis radicata]